MKRFKIPAIALAACTALLAAGCEDGAITSPDQVIFPESNVSFGRHVLPVLDLTCNSSGCHNDIDQAGGISMESYIALFRTPGLVRPGDSTGSVLWQVVVERLPHHAYPISRLINANQQHGIAVWLQEGASNN